MPPKRAQLLEQKMQAFFLMVITAVSKLGFSNLLMNRIVQSVQSVKRKRQQFAGYTPTAHDLFVCTYAKSGTNWTMQIAQQIAYYGEAEFAHIHDLVAWPDKPLPMPVVDLNNTEVTKRSPTGLRVIKTHLESDYVPYHPDAKYIFVVRDPKEAFVSSYYFGQTVFGAIGFNFSPDEWLQAFIANRFFFDSWPAHTASFWPWVKRDNVLFLTFAEMKADLPAVVHRIASLMKVSLTAKQFDRVVEKAGFQYMKAVGHKFAPAIPAFDRKKIRPVMMRRGESGKSKELIDMPQQAAIDRFCQSELRRLGSDFPYTDLFSVVDSVAVNTAVIAD